MKAVVFEREADFNVRPWIWLALAPWLVAACIVARYLPEWQLMGVLAVSILALVKWLTIAAERSAWHAAGHRFWAYALLWPGLDAHAFFDTSQRVARPAAREWFFAAAKTLFGAALFLVVAPRLAKEHELVAGWLAMAGLVFLVHFGIIHLASLMLRRAGMDAPPIMNAPILATSLSDFWGRRWNRAFRDFADRLLFRPLVRPMGVASATLAVFLFSGVVHDVVISLPARGGWGLPSVYFLLQGVGLIVERSRWARRRGLNRGLKGRLYCAMFLIAPAGLLFHPPFVRTVVLPMLSALTPA